MLFAISGIIIPSGSSVVPFLASTGNKSHYYYWYKLEHQLPFHIYQMDLAGVFTLAEK